MAGYVIDLIIAGAIGAVLGALLLHSYTGFTGLYAVMLSAHAVYLVGLWHTGQTVGMRATGVSVRRAEDGGRLTLARASVRFIPFLLALVSPVIGVLTWIGMVVTMATDTRGQGLHDRIAQASERQRSGDGKQ
jgi:uncharacterized RDD family membrane protein YckC